MKKIFWMSLFVFLCAPSAWCETGLPFGVGAVLDGAYLPEAPDEDDDLEGEFELLVDGDLGEHVHFDTATAFTEDGVELEEGFVELSLPLDARARAGRFRPAIGQAIPLHPYMLDTVDEPLVIARYFGDEGYVKSGGDLSVPLPFPWEAEHVLTAGVLQGGNGDDGTLFGETRHRPTLYASLANRFHAGPSTDWELGLSWLTGSRDRDSDFEVDVYGAGASVVHRYAPERRFKLLAEAFLVSREESFYELEDPVTGEITFQDLDDARNLVGFYTLADWRFLPQWSAGARFDRVETVETDEDFANPERAETGYTAYLSFHPAAWMRWRVQYSNVELTTGRDEDRVFIQGTIFLGEDRHLHEHEDENEHAAHAAESDG